MKAETEDEGEDDDENLRLDVSVNIRLGKENYEDDKKEDLETNLKADDD